jgi:hypothetical protein
VLDPRISYEGLMADYEQDANLLADLEKAKSALHTFYHDNYASFTLGLFKVGNYLPLKSLLISHLLMFYCQIGNKSI